MDKKALTQFLLKANAHGYAAIGEGRVKKEKDGSKTIVYEDGDFKMHDNYFGGEPYGGRMIVFYQSKPVWIMVYYGWVEKSVSDFSVVYQFLRKALSLMPEEAPFRGPNDFKENTFRYENGWQGDISQFSGEEKIFESETQIFKTFYAGGFINIKEDSAQNTS